MTRRWSREEDILALFAYCQVPFNKASNVHPWIVRIAKIIDRTPASVKMEIGNLGAFDPVLKERGIVGLSGYSKMDEEIWREFYGKWDLLSEVATELLQKYESNSGDIHKVEFHGPDGKEIEQLIKRRINQDFFRSSVLSSYNGRCCISGIKSEVLLEAAHIIAWKEEPRLRTDPSNGLCLNALLHKAYDNFLLSITPDYLIEFSENFYNAVDDYNLRHFIESRHGSSIILPDRFLPNPQYLEKHYLRFKVAQG